jgi:hypothetical protein
LNWSSEKREGQLEVIGVSAGKLRKALEKGVIMDIL